MAFTIRPATKADIAALSTMGTSTPTIKAMVAEVDGSPVALGGVAIIDGRHLAFCDLTYEMARNNKVAVVRAAKRFMADVRKRGTRFVYAQVDSSEPNSIKWLASLGFEPDPRNTAFYRWSAK